MNRYPLWKYVVIAVALVFGLTYTLPNFFGESPAVQISSGKPTVRIDPSMVDRVEAALADAQVRHDGIFFDTLGLSSTVRVRFADTDTQLKAKDILERALEPTPDDPAYVIALNLVSNSPRWLRSLNALPMYLGLDLRGGVHFMMQVDMGAAIDQRLETLTSDVRTLLRERNIRHAGINKSATAIEVRFRDAPTRSRALDVVRTQIPDLAMREEGSGEDLLLVATLTPTAQRAIQDAALRQNITTLHNRVNELGVAEPVIQQQGADRIVVQLPGVQDVARAKQILGRNATLEIRMVDQEAMAAGTPGAITVPERKADGSVTQTPLKREVIATGTQLINASATLDQNQQPAVSVRLDEAGGRAMRAVTRENIGRLMAIVLYERGRGEAISVARIQGEFGNQFQITGRFTIQETTDLALLIRSGALAAPMEYVEERTIGPSLGAENIARGVRATVAGFIAIAIFMVIYYRVFGLVSVAALTVNIALLIALLSLLQATLTLPGIAALALALGMAIDANVLINERVREELRNGSDPAAGDPGRLRQGVCDDHRLQRDDADRRCRAADLRIRAGARLRDRPLARHIDVDLLGRFRLARHRQPYLRVAQEAGHDFGRPGLETGDLARTSSTLQGPHGILPH
jgi:preprotein translocase subunit SecD